MRDWWSKAKEWARWGWRWASHLSTAAWLLGLLPSLAASTALIAWATGLFDALWGTAVSRPITFAAVAACIWLAAAGAGALLLARSRLIEIATREALFGVRAMRRETIEELLQDCRTLHREMTDYIADRELEKEQAALNFAERGIKNPLSTYWEGVRGAFAAKFEGRLAACASRAQSLDLDRGTLHGVATTILLNPISIDLREAVRRVVHLESTLTVALNDER
jgi:hypothetical protein